LSTTGGGGGGELSGKEGLSSGRGAIVLVPEIALTPQTVSRFVGRFEGVAVLHSGLTEGQRHEQWRRVRSGEARIVVGARSAVFAPLPRVGVIVVDEEHDASYKQDQLPRYHGRDVAIKRAQLLNIPVLLGSATPSLESYYNATCCGGSGSGEVSREGVSEKVAVAKRMGEGGRRYHLLRLPERVAGLKLPKVQVVDMKEERRRGVHLLSGYLEEALKRTLGSKGQAMLLLNRRGYANYIACADRGCGWMMSCEYCDAMMVYHTDGRLPSGGYLQCHHCQAEQLLRRGCPLCGKKVTVFGLGTQRVEEELREKFPGLRLLRMDSDSMKTRRDYEGGLGAFGRGEVEVLLGTQVIAKGLDFPNVRLVGVVSADTALNLPDFRASERTFQLVAQVAGRAGRGDHGGLVIVQTFNPEDVAIVLASRHDFEGFARREIALREKAGLPPCTRMARVVVRERSLEKCREQAGRLSERLSAGNAWMGGGVRVRGPMPCPVARINEYHRWQLELTAETAGAIQRLLTALRNERVLVSDQHTAVDVDPVALL
jgi:primosomal protein N' (replication factor Y)